VEKSAYTCEFIELTFKDQYIARSDMWRLKLSLINTSTYQGKKVASLGVRAQVKNCIMNNAPVRISLIRLIYSSLLDRRMSYRTFVSKVPCGYISETTKTIFRSESAKYFLFVHMSKEMWEFDEDGELFMEKCVHGFLPDLFKSWKRTGTNHGKKQFHHIYSYLH
jgi:DEP domain-containing protein 5